MPVAGVSQYLNLQATIALNTHYTAKIVDNNIVATASPKPADTVDTIDTVDTADTSSADTDIDTSSADTGMETSPLIIEETPLIIEDAPVPAATEPAVPATTEPAVPATTEPAIPAKYDDINYIAACTQAEALNQGIDGMRFVTDVILNRVDKEEFPNTATAVINQPHQFQVVSNGAIKKQLRDLKPEVIAMVKEEIAHRTNSEIIGFRTGHYGYGIPCFKYKAHYFSR